MQHAKRLKTILVVCFCIGAIFIYQRQRPVEKQSRRQLYSYLVGHELYSQLREYQPNHILIDVIKGMRDCEAGIQLPDNMSKEQKAKFLNEMEYELFHEWQMMNRAKAEAYLLSLNQQASLVTCIPLRLYYQILREGSGLDALSPDSTALFHYSITTLEGKEVFTTKGQEPKEVNLSDAIPGFSQAVIGMRINEQRKIFLHPDLGYRSSSWHVPPESLLIIDVERLKG